MPQAFFHRFCPAGNTYHRCLSRLRWIQCELLLVDATFGWLHYTFHLIELTNQKAVQSPQPWRRMCGIATKGIGELRVMRTCLKVLEGSFINEVLSIRAASNYTLDREHSVHWTLWNGQKLIILVNRSRNGNISLCRGRTQSFLT